MAVTSVDPRQQNGRREQGEKVDARTSQRRERGVWTFLTWSFFLSQAVAAEQAAASAAARGAHDGESSASISAAGTEGASNSAPPRLDGTSSAEPADGTSPSTQQGPELDARALNIPLKFAAAGEPAWADAASAPRQMSAPSAGSSSSSGTPTLEARADIPMPDLQSGATMPPSAGPRPSPGNGDPIDPPVDEVVDPIGGIIGGVVDPVVVIVETVIEDVVGPIIETVGGVLEPVVQIVDAVVEPVIAIVTDVAASASATVDSLLGEVVDPVTGTLGDLLGIVTTVTDDIFAPITNVATELTGDGTEIIAGLSPAVAAATDVVDNVVELDALDAATQNDVLSTLLNAEPLDGTPNLVSTGLSSGGSLDFDQPTSAGPTNELYAGGSYTDYGLALQVGTSADAGSGPTTTVQDAIEFTGDILSAMTGTASDSTSSANQAPLTSIVDDAGHRGLFDGLGL